MPSTDPARDPSASPNAANPIAYPAWRAVRGLFIFRVLLVAGLLLALASGLMSAGAASVNWRLVWPVMAVHGLLVLLSGVGLLLQRPDREQQIQLAIFVDLVAFTLLMHGVGGVSSGFGVLLALAVAAGALMLEGRLSLLFAALAALAVIAQQVYTQFEGVSQTPAYTQAGLLGILFFTVALLSNALYRRVRSAETLAARRQVDIANLSKLNDFIIRHIGTGILAVDGERRLRLINQAALELLGKPSIRPGCGLGELSPELLEWLAVHVRPEAEPDGELPIGARELKLSVRRLGQYRASGAILYLRDRQEVLNEARQVRLAALGTLTASIAHNIRNPLSAVAHAGQLLAESPALDAADRHLLAIVERNCARIEETVSSVLQLSRRRERQPERFDPLKWLNAFVDEFRDCHRLDPGRIVLECATPAPPLVETDPRHLRQILDNLCGNALLHGGSAERPAQLTLRIDSQDGPGGGFRLEIRDEGPGIDPALVPRIFDPFFTTRASGNGLGLYIARELADANRLRLEYRRREPSGSCFSLTWMDEASQ